MWSERGALRARRPGPRPRGFTLLEALMAIVVLGVGLAGLMAAFNAVGRRSADPLVQQQMLAIGQELMEEIRLKPYAAAAHTAPAACARDTYNDVRDFHGYASTGICSIDGTAIPELAAYSVSVSVTSGTWQGVAGALRISITVTRSGGDNSPFTLVSWRTDFAS